MQRITITLEDELLAELDAFMERSSASNRSEALRDLMRRGLAREAPDEADCVAVVSYTLDLSRRDLVRRVPLRRHERHDRAIASLSVPVDHEEALEVTVMRGPVAEVESFAHGLFLERGVRHGRLALIPVTTEIEEHDHGEGAHSHSHLKVRDSF
ncbi:nickel-responsive transcriptional regulator NikR [Acidimangrovimonas sediminis]|uniref:nickel-responsive transcriptional regulator NikR n=1 Tax=Acidimangrovimonas sediminis TaxID=2056283 RepID=UPI000C80E0CC|nr:nickel-responsive transcriptional regulator NikR [Acidimangrovimonas sediminis]